MMDLTRRGFFSILIPYTKRDYSDLYKDPHFRNLIRLIIREEILYLENEKFFFNEDRIA